MNPVYTLFNSIASRMIHKEAGEEYMSNEVTVLGTNDSQHTLSINQLQLFMGVMDGTHPFLKDHNPLEFLIFSYQFQDKIKMNYLAVQYQIIYDCEADTIFVSGITKHPCTVKGHPDYIEGSYVPVEQFQTSIENVGLYGSIALINCIAAQDEKFEPVRGSFGGSFIYEMKNGQLTINRYEAQDVDELGIQEDELQEAIGKAVDSVQGGKTYDLPVPGSKD